MDSSTLHVVIRTPREVVVDAEVLSLRLPTETGQVGLRPRCEPSVLAVEPGLIALRQRVTTQFAGTAGGLLYCDGKSAQLLTPVAVAGGRPDVLLEELDRILAAPSAEREVRTMLKRLEQNILQEVQHGGEGRQHRTESSR